MKKKTFLILFVFVFLEFTGFVHANIPASERAALIALYNSTNGDNWGKPYCWKTPPLDTDGFAMPGTEANWFGVTISNGHVSQISMSNNQMSGSIPPELGNLSKLEYLDLRVNQLNGSIPSQLGNLLNLTGLYLRNNKLSGSIPPELGNLRKLQYLSLNQNRLSGSIPFQLGNLLNLIELSLNSNQLSGSIPSQLGNLSYLTKLSLGFNNLSGGIPTSLGNIRGLSELLLNSNNLSGSIPSELGNLSNLGYLFLWGNQLSGSIPPTLGNLSELRNLALADNQLSGSIPSEFGNLSYLIDLNLSSNELSGSIPSELGNLSNLMDLNLSSNDLGGSIPPGLGNLRKLDFLYLQKNQLSGNIPSSFTALTRIKNLDIAYNCLSATDTNLRDWLNIHDPDWEATQCKEKEPPFGSFDTPVDGSTVSGSIAVTGWALDDGGLEGVKIYLTQGDTQTYIGDALFVEGARPDVAAAFPNYPDNTKAGWGYMMLTNILPGGGNGTFVLSAIAVDRVEKATTLGSKIIIVDNAHAVKPFGAVDTPTQGGTAMGSSFTNQGWLLTPQPNNIPTDGSTISVWVDGVNKGHPGYNLYRADIAALFPGYANSNGAAAYFYLDTTQYPDGIHTIFWVAADNGGNCDGIGSRYFTIQNTESDMDGLGVRSQGSGVKEKCISAAAFSPWSPDSGLYSPVPNSNEPVSIIKGYHEDTATSQIVYPDANGIIAIEIKELERVEIQLGEKNAHIQGYSISSNGLNKLPIGSTLDAKSGTFSWIPGPGFIGNYSLVFILTDANGQSFKKSVEIKIEPKFNN